MIGRNILNYFFKKDTLISKALYDYIITLNNM